MEKQDNDIRNIPKGVRMFYKHGIELCNHKWPCYGGHHHWLANLLRIDYLYIGVYFKIKYQHDWYDGQHHSIWCGLIVINWGGRPYLDA